MGSRARTWQDVADFAESQLGSTFGRPAAVASVALHPSLDWVAVAAEVRDSLLAAARSVIVVLQDGQEKVLREGWIPSWSPDGDVLAHVDAAGLWIGELHRPLPSSVERLAWDSTGTQLLLLMAEPGADQSGAAGSGQVAGTDGKWMPSVEGAPDRQGWRRLAIVNARSGDLRWVGRPDLNIWDACWAGPDIVAVCSDGDPGESAWYSADLRVLDTVTGQDEVVCRPQDQLGSIAASPSGRWIAHVESVCSDRDIVIGDLKLVDRSSGQVRHLTTPGDVASVAFVSEEQIGFTGLEGMTTRIGFISTAGDVRLAWESEEQSTVGTYPTASFRAEEFASAPNGDAEPPMVVLTGRDGERRVLAPLCRYAVPQPSTVSRVHSWIAPDGLSIEGRLLLPDAPGPHPLVVLVHGGPVYSWRPSWTGHALLRQRLLDRGYALLMPNPRGSSGRGQAFARAVVGDMGGADAQDVLSGVRSLVDEGIADPQRLGITGGSYGGFLSTWLVTQTDMFAAAVALYPITDWGHQHGCSNLAAWDERFLDGAPYAEDGQYIARSPLRYADRVTTPLLLVAGGLDRATPPGQALAMQRAVACLGVSSECVTYPLIGHGASDMSVVIDQVARTLEWFQLWMPSRSA